MAMVDSTARAEFEHRSNRQLELVKFPYSHNREHAASSLLIINPALDYRTNLANIDPIRKWSR